MIDWPGLIAFLATFALAVMSPGPNFAFLLRIGLGHGRRAALRTVLGIAVGEAVWGAAAVFGAAALALRYPAIGAAIRWGGGLYLLWLAALALRSAWRGGDDETAAAGADADAATGRAGRGGFAAGLALMLLNAKAGFFWVSVTGLLLGPHASPATGLIVVAAAVVLSLLWHSLLAVAFSGGPAVRLYRRARRRIEGALGAALAALGIKILAAS